MVGLHTPPRFPVPTGRMFMARPHRRALAFLGSGSLVSVKQRGGIGTASTCEADRPTRVAPRPNLTFGAVAASASWGCHGLDGRSCHHFGSDATACAPCARVL